MNMVVLQQISVFLLVERKMTIKKHHLYRAKYRRCNKEQSWLKTTPLTLFYIM